MNRRLPTASVLAALTLLMTVATMPAAWAARLTNAQFNPTAQTLTFNMAEGTFDPAFSVEALATQIKIGKNLSGEGANSGRTVSPGYRTTILGEKVKVDDALWSRLATLLYTLKQQPGVDDATLDNLDGQLVLRIESRQPIRPIVLQHKGSQIVIALRNIPTKAPKADQSETQANAKASDKANKDEARVAQKTPAKANAKAPASKLAAKAPEPIAAGQIQPEGVTLSQVPAQVPAPATTVSSVATGASGPTPTPEKSPAQQVAQAATQAASAVTQQVAVPISSLFDRLRTGATPSDAKSASSDTASQSDSAAQAAQMAMTSPILSIPQLSSPVLSSGASSLLQYSPTPLYAQELEPEAMAGVMVPHLADAWQQYRNGNAQQARQQLDDYRAAHPEDGAGHTLALMMANADDNPLQGALASQQLYEHQLQAMTDNSPSASTEAAMMLVRTFVASGKLDAASQVLSGLNQKLPRSAEVNYLQGMLSESSGNLASARKQYLQALSNNSEHFLAHYRMAMVALKQNRLDEALWELGEVLQRRPDDAEALKAMGIIAQRQGRLDKAAGYYKRALKPDLLANYALVLRQQGQKEQALAVANAARVIAPDNLDVQYTVGMLLSELGDTRSGKQLLSAFLAREASGERAAQARAKLGKLGAK
ncbi:MAG: tetratricopeptide repeat protein [Vampirovibrionales bacterium]|nr:tetratricopeptide repeat protein [Vampirovibrionales bacterium]